MHVNGIIAEYNPFHNGHEYHLRHGKEITGADYTVVVMSGNFTQRGAPALFSKHLRTRTALLCGADLVLELPLYWSCGSAQYFARGAAALLDKLGVIDTLCFGSEEGAISPFLELAELLQNEPPDYRQLLQSALRSGKTYPQARAFALAAHACLPAQQEKLLSAPNNLLGAEYCCALSERRSSIRPVTIRRSGAGYHAAELETQKAYPSALSLRNALKGQDTPAAIYDFLPSRAYEVLTQGWQIHGPVWDDALSGLLHYRLTLLEREGFSMFADVSEALSDRIRNKLPAYTSFSGFCSILKTKDLTYTRVSRSLLHILLDMRTETLEEYAALDYTPYARMLGFRRDALPLLHAIKKNSSVPLLSRLPDARYLLDKGAYRMLEDDIRATHIYQGLLTSLYGTPVQNEFSQELVII